MLYNWDGVCPQCGKPTVKRREGSIFYCRNGECSLIEIKINKHFIEKVCFEAVVKVNVLVIVDVFGWAYDSIARDLEKYLPRASGSIVVDRCLFSEVELGYVKPEDYHVVLCFAWFNGDGEQINLFEPVLQKLNPNRTVLIVASENIANYLPWISETALRNFKIYATQSRRLYEFLRGTMPDKKWFLLEGGVDLEEFKYTPLPEKFTVGWAGNENRRLKRFKEAEEICLKADVEMVHAGNIYSESYISPNAMPQWYSRISCLLITSESEVHPLVAYESLACGRPVIATDVGDLKEIAGESALIFSELNVEEMSEAVKTLKNDRGSLKDMSLKAREIVEEKLNWNSQIASYSNLILNIRGKK